MAEKRTTEAHGPVATVVEDAEGVVIVEAAAAAAVAVVNGKRPLCGQERNRLGVGPS